MNALEEIKAIWEQQTIDLPNDLNINICMNEPDIFMPNTVEWSMQKHECWIIRVQFDPFYHVVYQIDVTTLGNGAARYRWVNPKYLERYHQNNFEYQIDDKHIKELNTDNSPDKILMIARDVVNGVIVHPSKNKTEEETETIALDLNDSELALIARAAHEKDITINQFMNDVIREELDKVMPHWREEIKKSV
jgi:hypothetical protein